MPSYRSSTSSPINADKARFIIRAWRSSRRSAEHEAVDFFCAAIPTTLKPLHRTPPKSTSSVDLRYSHIPAFPLSRPHQSPAFTRKRGPGLPSLGDKRGLFRNAPTRLESPQSNPKLHMNCYTLPKPPKCAKLLPFYGFGLFTYFGDRVDLRQLLFKTPSPPPTPPPPWRGPSNRFRGCLGFRGF